MSITSAQPGRLALARGLAGLQSGIAVTAGGALLAIGASNAAGWTIAGAALLVLGALWIWVGIAVGGRNRVAPLLAVILSALTLLAILGSAALAGPAALPAAALPAATLYCLLSAGSSLRGSGPHGALPASHAVVRLEKRRGLTVQTGPGMRPERVPKAPPGYYPPPVGEHVQPSRPQTRPPAPRPSGPPPDA